jgi:hypothetical protein
VREPADHQSGDQPHEEGRNGHGPSLPRTNRFIHAKRTA